MLKYPGLIFLTFFLINCSNTRFNRDKERFEASKVSMTFKSVSDLNDDYFEIRENNFFEFYKQLFDSVKNTRYPGTYTMDGDTMILKFYNKKGEKLLGKKAYINNNKREIIFFDHHPEMRKRLVVN